MGHGRADRATSPRRAGGARLPLLQRRRPRADRGAPRAGVSQEAARTAKLLGLAAWNGLSAEGQHGNVHLAHPTPDALLLVVRERGVPLGRLAILAQRATLMARRWLEQQ